MSHNACLLLALAAGARAAEAPPTFAAEYSLSYKVTNYQYGFVAVGRETASDGFRRAGAAEPSRRRRADAAVPVATPPRR